MPATEPNNKMGMPITKGEVTIPTSTRTEDTLDK